MNKIENIIVNKTVLIAFYMFVFVFAIYFFKFHSQIISEDAAKWGVFGDFVGGTLNPFLSFLALIILLRTFSMQHEELAIQREELKDTKEILKAQSQTQVKQQFESTFFALLDLHNRVLANILEANNLRKETNDIWNLKLDCAKTQLQDKQLWKQYSRILHSLLKFIDVHSPLSDSEKMYNDIVKLLLPDDVLKLLLIECHRDNDEYKSLIEKYALFENASFSVNLDLDEEGEKMMAITFDGKAIIYDAKKFYDPKAFGQ